MKYFYYGEDPYAEWSGRLDDGRVLSVKTGTPPDDRPYAIEIPDWPNDPNWPQLPTGLKTRKVPRYAAIVQIRADELSIPLPELAFACSYAKWEQTGIGVIYVGVGSEDNMTDVIVAVNELLMTYPNSVAGYVVEEVTPALALASRTP